MQTRAITDAHGLPYPYAAEGLGRFPNCAISPRSRRAGGQLRAPLRDELTINRKSAPVSDPPDGCVGQECGLTAYTRNPYQLKLYLRSVSRDLRGVAAAWIGIRRAALPPT